LRLRRDGAGPVVVGGVRGRDGHGVEGGGVGAVIPDAQLHGGEVVGEGAEADGDGLAGGHGPDRGAIQRVARIVTEAIPEHVVVVGGAAGDAPHDGGGITDAGSGDGDGIAAQGQGHRLGEGSAGAHSGGVDARAVQVHIHCDSRSGGDDAGHVHVGQGKVAAVRWTGDAQLDAGVAGGALEVGGGAPVCGVPVLRRVVDGVLGVGVAQRAGAPGFCPEGGRATQAAPGDPPLQHRGGAGRPGGPIQRAILGPAAAGPAPELGATGAVGAVHPGIEAILRPMGIIHDHVAAPGIGGGAVGVVGRIQVDDILAPVRRADVGIDGKGKVVARGVLGDVEVHQVHHGVAVAVGGRVGGGRGAIGRVNDAVHGDGGRGRAGPGSEAIARGGGVYGGGLEGKTSLGWSR